MPAERDRLGDAGDQPAGDRQGDVGLADSVEEHEELVTAVPDGDVVAAHRLPQPVRDPAEHLVAAAVAEGVVDVLEAVEVDEEHRRAGAGSPVAGERTSGQGQAAGAVRQLGQ